jgi:hypothetical protein
MRFSTKCKRVEKRIEGLLLMTLAHDWREKYKTLLQKKNNSPPLPFSHTLRPKTNTFKKASHCKYL